MNKALLAATILSLAGCLVLALRSRRHDIPRLPATSRSDITTGAQAVSDPSLALEILEEMGEGVMVLDRGLRPQFANHAARELLGLQPGPLPSRIPAFSVTEIAEAAVRSGEPVDGITEVWYPERRTLKAHGSPLEPERGCLVVLQDVSEELRTQKMRRDFVAHASHELKSPVASLQALAEAVAQALEEDPEAAGRFTGKLVAESQRLSKLVTDLLDLSRLEESTHPPESICDLAHVARHELAQIEHSVHEQGISLTYTLVDHLEMKGDAQQLGLMLRNLLENAVQYTPEGGCIEVEIGAEGSEANLRVSDDGAGIPLEAQSRIFERFYRVDKARSRVRGGTGLGLAIVKHVVELHGGRIEVHSELGQGSTFVVHLPIGDFETGTVRSIDKETA